MSNNKYYNDNNTQYQGGNGTLYYTPSGGHPGVNSINWMSTVNFSRTLRLKTIEVRQVVDGGLSKTFNINQLFTPLTIFLDNVVIGNSPIYGNGNRNGETADVDSFQLIWSVDINENDLGKLGYIVVLINGNVISAELLDEDNNITYPIESIGNKTYYDYSITYEYNMYVNGNNPESEYQLYPSYINNRIGEIYQLRNITSYVNSNPSGYDSIIGDSGTLESILPATNSLCFDSSNEIYDYGKYIGLIAVKIPFTINSLPPDYDSNDELYYDSCILIRTAVYDRTLDDGVNLDLDNFQLIKIYFRYSVETPSISDIDNLVFDAGGTKDGDHAPETTINSNTSWVVVP